MKVSGFTFVRNAIQYDYPVVQAIQSILPLCDEVVVAVGNSSDETLQLIQSINSSKIRIIETVWDDSLRSGGRVLALETDKAYKAITSDTDWAFYIQADEVLHEQYHPTVREAMERYTDDAQVDGLLFKYRHFYGSYDYVGDSYMWYRREIRVVRFRQDIYSYRDAQGFRKQPNEKLHVAEVDAYIHHYGWVRDPHAMFSKQQNFLGLYNRVMDQDTANREQVFDYSKVDALVRYTGTHPAVMRERIANLNWEFSFDPTTYTLKFKDRIKRFFERVFGWRMGEYRNYIRIKD